jgi:hypothetical protein
MSWDKSSLTYYNRGYLWTFSKLNWRYTTKLFNYILYIKVWVLYYVTSTETYITAVAFWFDFCMLWAITFAAADCRLLSPFKHSVGWHVCVLLQSTNGFWSQSLFKYQWICPLEIIFVLKQPTRYFVLRYNHIIARVHQLENEDMFSVNRIFAWTSL